MVKFLSDIHWFIYTKTGQFDEVIFSLPFLAAAVLIYRSKRKKRLKKMLGESFDGEYRRERWQEAVRLMFFAYITELAFVTLAPSEFWGGFWRHGPFVVIQRFLQFSFCPPKLVPTVVKLVAEGFPEWFWSSGSFAHILINIALFMPFGLLLPLQNKGTGFAKTVLFGFTASLAIEVFQLFIRRDSDIDDLICNTLGAMLGYLVFLLVKRIRHKGRTFDVL